MSHFSVMMCDVPQCGNTTKPREVPFKEFWLRDLTRSFGRDSVSPTLAICDKHLATMTLLDLIMLAVGSQGGPPVELKTEQEIKALEEEINGQ